MRPDHRCDTGIYYVRRRRDTNVAALVYICMYIYKICVAYFVDFFPRPNLSRFSSYAFLFFIISLLREIDTSTDILLTHIYQVLFFLPMISYEYVLSVSVGVWPRKKTLLCVSRKDNLFKSCV